MNRMGMLSCLLAGALALPLAAAVSVSYGIGAMSVTARNAEVLVAPDAPSATRFAAQELVKFLSQVLGAPVPLANTPSGSKVAIVVGENKWSRAAGVDISALKRDGFVIKCVPWKRRIYVVGRDDAIALLAIELNADLREAGASAVGLGEVGDLDQKRILLWDK